MHVNDMAIAFERQRTHTHTPLHAHHVQGKLVQKEKRKWPKKGNTNNDDKE